MASKNEVEILLRLRDMFTKELKEAGRDLGDFAEGAEEQNQKAERSFTELNQAMELTKKAVDLLKKGWESTVGAARKYSDEIISASDRTGMSVERFQEWNAAAIEAKVKTDQLADGLQTLGERITESAVEKAGEGHEALSQLGVSAIDPVTGKARKLEDVLFDVADRFKDLDGQVEFRTTKALQLFGDTAGERLVSMLSKGSAGLKEFMKEAKELGLVIDEDALRAAREMDVQLDKLQRVAEGLGIEVGLRLAPAINETAEAMLRGVREGGLLKGVLEGIGEAYDQIRQATGANNVSPIDQMQEDIAAFDAQIQGLQGKLQTKLNAIADLRRQGAEESHPYVVRLRNEAQAIGNEMRAIQAVADDFADMVANAIEGRPGPQDQGGGGSPIQVGGSAAGTAGEAEAKKAQALLDRIREENVLAAKDEFDKLRHLEAKTLEAFAGNAEAQHEVSVYYTRKEQELYDERFAKLVEMQAKEAELTEQEAEKRAEELEELRVSTLDELAQLEAKQAKELEMAEGHEQLLTDLKKKHTKERADLEAKLGQDELRMQQQIEDAKQQAAANNAQAMFTLANIFGRKNFYLSKALGVAEAIVAANVGAAKALATIPPPANVAVANSIRAMGFANAAAIAATAIGGGPGGGGGGGLAVGGGAGGGGPTVAPEIAPAAATDSRSGPGPSMNVYLSISTLATDARQVSQILVPELERLNRDGNFNVEGVQLG